MIEKKLILCAILAITIGIATIVPLEYLMSAPVAKADVDQPWFNANVTYAYVNLDQSGGNSTASWDGVDVNGLANFTLTPAGMALQGADAKIEYYQFQISSDQGPIANITYSVYLTIEELGSHGSINNIPGLPGGGYMAITGLGANSYTFANGVTYNGIPNYNGYCGGAGGLDVLVGDNSSLPEGATNQTFTQGFISSFLASYNGNQNQAITELRNAKTLTIDVTRICSVSYNGNVTVNMSSSNQVLQNIVLTKEGNGFVYGTCNPTIPVPIESPSNPTGAWQQTYGTQSNSTSITP
jgi:hypothetical protein